MSVLEKSLSRRKSCLVLDFYLSLISPSLGFRYGYIRRIGCRALNRPLQEITDCHDMTRGGSVRAFLYNLNGLPTASSSEVP